MRTTVTAAHRETADAIADSGELERRLLLPDGDLVGLMLFELAQGSLRA